MVEIGGIAELCAVRTLGRQCCLGPLRDQAAFLLESALDIEWGSIVVERYDPPG
jgi:hypothetical protein